MTGFSESIVEDAALSWLEALGYQVLHGPEIAVGEIGAEHLGKVAPAAIRGGLGNLGEGGFGSTGKTAPNENGQSRKTAPKKKSIPSPAAARKKTRSAKAPARNR